MSSQTNFTESSRAQRWTIGVLAAVILTVSFYGFGDKLVQFVLVARGEPEGVFALTPIINYLLASFGFLCLLGWAAANGMFTDIERPKRTMLETEMQLDAANQRESHVINQDRNNDNAR